MMRRLEQVNSEAVAAVGLSEEDFQNVRERVNTMAGAGKWEGRGGDHHRCASAHYPLPPSIPSIPPAPSSSLPQCLMKYQVRALGERPRGMMGRGARFLLSALSYRNLSRPRAIFPTTPSHHVPTTPSQADPRFYEKIAQSQQGQEEARREVLGED